MRTMVRLMGVLTIVACGFSASAGASMWTDKHNPLVGNPTIPLTGSFSFTGSLGGVNCTGGVKSAAQLFAFASNGSLSEFNPTIAMCDLTGGIAGTCTSLTAVHPENLPYEFHNNGTDISLTKIRLTYTIAGGFLCPKTIIINGNATLTADPNQGTIQSLTFFGTLSSSVGGNVTLGGTAIPVNAGDDGRYGF